MRLPLSIIEPIWTLLSVLLAEPGTTEGLPDYVLAAIAEAQPGTFHLDEEKISR